MKIFNQFQHINLTQDQSNALEMLQSFIESDERVFVLQGYAGSGKTTLLKGVVNYLVSIQRKYQLMAPTGRAAKVINQKTGFVATTLHRGIYSFEKLEEIEESKDENDISFLYRYQIANNTDVHDSVLIVDEASMVSDVVNRGEFFRFGSGRNLLDLIKYSRIQENATSSKIIFIGDPAQLPPIGMNFSPALTPQYLEEEYNVKVSHTEMKEVKRQDATNGILKSATKIRQSLTSGYFNDFDLRENHKDILNPPYKDFLETYKAQNNQKIIICFKNKTALDLNKEIRHDRFGDDLPIQKSDIVIIGGNNYRLGILNGEFGVVAEASPSVESREVRFTVKGGRTESVRLTWRNVTLIIPDENNQPKNVNGHALENYLYGDNVLRPEEQRALYIDFKNRHPKVKKGTEEFKDAITTDKYFNCIKLKYGYAVTGHKAQGGEWSKAFVFWDRTNKDSFNHYERKQDHIGKTNADFYRWAYTAITRASEKLYCINPPYFSSFSEMKYIGPDVQRSFDEIADKKTSTIDLSINEVMPLLKKFSLEELPNTIQDHFIYRWYHLNQQGIEVAQWKRVGYEIRYVFKKDEQTAAIKYWVNGKNQFRSNYQVLPAQTNSEELFENITKILENAQEVAVTRGLNDSGLESVEFDLKTEEERPFLKNLYERICNKLAEDEIISSIEHLNFRERYTVDKNGNECVIDFEYNKEGFLGRVLPIENRCNNADLLRKLPNIIENLKTSDHVI